MLVYPLLVLLGWVYVRRAERNERHFADLIGWGGPVTMSLDAVPGIVAVTLVTVATLAIGTWGLRFSRTTSDFFVASRTVSAPAQRLRDRRRVPLRRVVPRRRRAGADLRRGHALVPGRLDRGLPRAAGAGGGAAAPLGAYTLPDFAEARLGSRSVRAVCSLIVVAVGWLYLLPQFQGAGLTLRSAIGAPTWVGPVIVALVVLANVSSGGMRSITFVQAFQYWLKLTALLVPAAVLLVVWAGDRATAGPPAPADWSVPLASGGAPGLYTTYSLIVATFLGTMGLPHVVVRFYTNPDGRAARRTTLVVLGLLGIFYLLPPVYGALGRIYATRARGVRALRRRSCSSCPA